jgi:hypothetical protein
MTAQQQQPEEKSGGFGRLLLNLGKAFLRVLQALVFILASLLKGIGWVLGKLAGAGRGKKKDTQSE